jgi:hypothetical protein
MLVLKSYFLSEMERYELEAKVLQAMNEVSEGEILELDDRELMELANRCHSQKLIG